MFTQALIYIHLQKPVPKIYLQNKQDRELNPRLKGWMGGE